MKAYTLILAIAAALALTSCNHEPARDEKPGIHINGKKGGELDVDKEGVKVEGKNGGGVNVDKDGAETKKADK
ncbi:MAG: hypothetical protein JSS76_05605 [Bacteroidetes bacterium]|nr:hypothetical protein [Bacteroidota bacterium]